MKNLLLLNEENMITSKRGKIKSNLKNQTYTRGKVGMNKLCHYNHCFYKNLKKKKDEIKSAANNGIFSKK
jgi:hypothetical protein